MADIRQNTTVLDDFNRADEEPLSHGGDWQRTDSIWSQGLRLKYNVPLADGAAYEPSTGSKFGASYWTPMSMDGDDAEFWGNAIGGNYPGIHWEISLVSSPGGSSAVDGYGFRRLMGTGGGSLRLIKILNGDYSNILASIASGVPTAQQWMLIRRNGNAVECWMATNTSSWTLWMSVNDVTYTTGLFGSIELSDNARLFAHGWDDVGGGPLPQRRLPQIYRIIHAAT